MAVVDVVASDGNVVVEETAAVQPAQTSNASTTALRAMKAMLGRTAESGGYSFGGVSQSCTSFPSSRARMSSAATAPAPAEMIA